MYLPLNYQNCDTFQNCNHVIIAFDIPAAMLSFNVLATVWYKHPDDTFFCSPAT